MLQNSMLAQGCHNLTLAHGCRNLTLAHGCRNLTLAPPSAGQAVGKKASGSRMRTTLAEAASSAKFACVTLAGSAALRCRSQQRLSLAQGCTAWRLTQSIEQLRRRLILLKHLPKPLQEGSL